MASKRPSVQSTSQPRPQPRPQQGPSSSPPVPPGPIMHDPALLGDAIRSDPGRRPSSVDWGRK